MAEAERRAERGERRAHVFGVGCTTAASRAAEQVCIQLERQHYAAAHAAIERFRIEQEAADAPRIGPALERELAGLVPLKTANLLEERCSVVIVRDLATGGWTRERLLRVPQCGEVTVREIEQALATIGLPHFFRAEPLEEPADEADDEDDDSLE